MMICRVLLAAFVFSLLGCAPDGPIEPWEAGVFHVGTARFEVEDGARDRTLLVQIWYPTEADEVERPTEDFVPAGAEHDAFAQLVADAPVDCTSRTSRGAPNAPVFESRDAWPLVSFSHCLNCTRFSSFGIAEHLASHGMVVVAPDHAGNTLFDDLAGESTWVSGAALDDRVADIRFVLDRMLDGSDPWPAEVGSLRLDAERVGSMGHSFGSVTTGMVLQEDPRPIAGLGLAAPMENPLIPGVEMEAIDDPLLLLVATEDNSITELGNEMIRRNFEEKAPPVWKVEVADAGHWSVSNLCAVVEDLEPGCGEAQRQTVPGETFSYLPVATGIEISRGFAAAFFGAYLLDQPELLDGLKELDSTGFAQVQARR